MQRRVPKLNDMPPDVPRNSNQDQLNPLMVSDDFSMALQQEYDLNLSIVRY